MQRGVHKTESQRLAVHHIKCCFCKLLHIRLQVVEGFDALLKGVGQNHVAQFLERLLAILAIEHVLDAEQADTLSAESDGATSVVRIVGIGADTQGAVFVNQLHELLEERILGSVDHLHLFGIDPTLGAVQRDGVALVEGLVGDGDGLTLEVDLHGLATHDAAFAPTAGHQSCVGGHTSASGKDTVGGTHTLDVLGVGLLANEDVLYLGCLILFGFLARESYAAVRTTRTCGQTLGDDGVLLLVGGVEDGVQKLIQLSGRHTHNHLFLVDQTLFHHVGSHSQSSNAGTFSDAALKHIQLAVLDGELYIQHIVEAVFQSLTDVAEFLISFGHKLLHRVHVLVLLVLGVVVQRVGGTDTGHHILALGVDEPLAIEEVFAGGGVTGESNAGGAVVAHIAEHHSLHVDGSTPIVGNTLDATVANGLLTVPALEHGLDAAFHLSAGVIRELGAQHLFHLLLEILGQAFEVIGGEVGVALVAFLLFESVKLRMPLPSAGSIPSDFSITTSAYIMMRRR